MSSYLNVSIKSTVYKICFLLLKIPKMIILFLNTLSIYTDIILNYKTSMEST